MNAIIFRTKNQMSNNKFQIKYPTLHRFFKPHIWDLGFAIWNLKSGSLKVISLQKDTVDSFSTLILFLLQH